eukprot:193885-Pyramimonas_sp.AAC.1
MACPQAARIFWAIILGVQIVSGHRYPFASCTSKTETKLQPIRRRDRQAAPKGPRSAAHFPGWFGKIGSARRYRSNSSRGWLGLVAARQTMVDKVRAGPTPARQV